jgi:lycopene cyclase domain-containing protein
MLSDYMKVLVIAGCVPVVLSFFPPIRLYRYWRALAETLLVIVLFFGTWDIYATARGHWSFNPSGVWRARIVNLPVEEVLFFAVIPWCCIFSWEVIQYFRRPR